MNDCTRIYTIYESAFVLKESCFPITNNRFLSHRDVSLLHFSSTLKAKCNNKLNSVDVHLHMTFWYCSSLQCGFTKYRDLLVITWTLFYGMEAYVQYEDSTLHPKCRNMFVSDAKYVRYVSMENYNSFPFSSFFPSAIYRIADFSWRLKANSYVKIYTGKVAYIQTCTTWLLNLIVCPPPVRIFK